MSEKTKRNSSGFSLIDLIEQHRKGVKEGGVKVDYQKFVLQKDFHKSMLLQRANEESKIM